MELQKLLESSNPVRKAGKFIGKLESINTTSSEAEMIAEGDEKMIYSAYFPALRRDIVVEEDGFPDSFVDGYRQAMYEASQRSKIDYTEDYRAGD